MLGLVSYEGSSDEEDSNDSIPEVQTKGHSQSTSEQTKGYSQSTSELTASISDEEDVITSGTDGLENLRVASNSSTFQLPLPTSHSLKPPIQVTKGSKGVKISIPSLDEFDDEEEDKPRKVKFTASTKGCGLFSMLPKPRNEFLATPRQLPVKKPATTVSAGQAKKPTVSKTESSHVEDDEEEVCDDGDFFTIPEKTNVDDVPEKPLEEYMKPLVQKKPTEKDAPTVSHDSQAQSYPVITEEVPVPQEDIELNNEVLRKLGARKRKGEELIVREVDGSQLIPDAQEWLQKSLSQETAYRPSAKKHEGPTNQQKRKHQITYLAHQAKANELDLKNQWANNRQTKRTTQSKYGF